MSSVYKKGRDGYFYYQAYVKDEITGKKTKRIFHSLGTKDRSVALDKQIILDKKYKNKSKKNKNKILIYYQKTKLRILLVTVFSTLVFLLFYKSPIFSSINGNYSLKDNNFTSSSQNLVAIDKEPEINELKKINPEQDNLSLEVNEIEPLIKSDDNNLLPEYNIHKIDKLSGSFSQAKIFITVSSKTTSDMLLRICESVMKENINYSNLVICLYAESKIGREIARSSGNQILTNDSPKSWLAMYTYNSVEGAYFDDNPSQYMRGF
ncbi:MAG: hypothetical protein CMG63_02850 [Candidatus Marinimicrobia bacterium]|nr:hypothetical protein [Candidatus Neomarinimicrobiota bacterium]